MFNIIVLYIYDNNYGVAILRIFLIKCLSSQEEVHKE